MLTLNGYSNRLSVKPGESIRFFVSGVENSHCDARIVRVYCGDTHPDGPGPRYDHVPSDIGEIVNRRRMLALTQLRCRNSVNTSAV